jgi:hypothetical protein
VEAAGRRSRTQSGRASRRGMARGTVP